MDPAPGETPGWRSLVSHPWSFKAGPGPPRWRPMAQGGELELGMAPAGWFGEPGSSRDFHWIGLRENLQETMGFYHQIYRAFRLKFSHHPILWDLGNLRDLDVVFGTWMARKLSDGWTSSWRSFLAAHSFYRWDEHYSSTSLGWLVKIWKCWLNQLVRFLPYFFRH